MAKQCLIEACKREAETFCYHCSHDVCTKHYLEHKNSIQEQLHPLVDQINLLYDRLSHDDKNNQIASVPQSLTDTCNQLDKWRDDCHHRIEITYDRVRHQIDSIVEGHRQDAAQKRVKNLESVEKLRDRLKELLKEGDVTHRQMEITKQKLEEIRKKEHEPVKYPDIRIVTGKVDLEKCVSIITDSKHPNEKPQQAKITRKTSLNKNSFVHRRLAGWCSSRQLAEKCPMCSEIFPVSMTMTDRTVHINEHLPD